MALGQWWRVVRHVIGRARLPENVVRRSDGQLAPAPGYEWVSGEPGDFSVRWVPGKEWPGTHLEAGSAQGNWKPAPGYAWVRPGDPSSAEVYWVPGTPHNRAPHVLAAEAEGKWRTESGYRWMSREPGDLRVERDGARDRRGNRSQPDLTAAGLERIKDLATLGLEEGATWVQIESAFRRLEVRPKSNYRAAPGT